MSYNGMAVQGRPNCIIIHHSSADTDTPAGIMSYHRSKWLDCGYHWMEYKGQVFMGRAMKYKGAHAKKRNNESIGFCFVGNYMNKLPKQSCINSAVEFIAKLCFSMNIDTKDIIGHRDVGSTDCPGDALYGFLPEFRKLVEEKIKEQLPNVEND